MARLLANVQRLVAIVEWFAAREAAQGIPQRQALARDLWRACWPPRPPGRLVRVPTPRGMGYVLHATQSPPRRGRPRLQLAARWRRVLDAHGLGDAVHRQKVGADQGSVLLQLFELQTRGPGRPRQPKPPTS